MKVILSRKVFDSSYGRCPSPIFEDDTFVSLPIPEKDKCVKLKFSEIEGPYSISSIVEDLTRGFKKPVTASDQVHLDPDLRFDSRPRKPGWRPLFGQSDAAAGHLQNHKVGKGDIFLFFGWFRRVENYCGHFRFKRGAPDLHMFFGWLEVGEVWHVEDKSIRIPEWASEHPHIVVSYPKNTVYVADQTDGGYKAGVFSRYSDELVITAPAPNTSRCYWRLPKWFHPGERNSKLTYHSRGDRWTSFDTHVELKSVARGQEFILDTADYPEAEDWARQLIGTGFTG